MAGMRGLVSPPTLLFSGSCGSDVGLAEGCAAGGINGVVSGLGGRLNLSARRHREAIVKKDQQRFRNGEKYALLGVSISVQFHGK
jgi:hypothetical protein